MWLIAVQGVLFVLVAVLFGFGVRAYVRPWRQARDILGSASGGADILAAMRTARARWAGTAVVIAVVILVAFVAVGLLIATAVSAPRMGENGAGFGSAWSDVLGEVLPLPVLAGAAPAIGLCIGVPVLAGCHAGLLGARRALARELSAQRHRSADPSTDRMPDVAGGATRAEVAQAPVHPAPADALDVLRVGWASSAVVTLGALGSVCAALFGLILVAALISGAASAVACSRPGAKCY